MLSIVIDTNVLFSALNNPDGTSAEALGTILAHPELFRMCYTCHMMDEYQDVLHRQKLVSRVSSAVVDELLDIIAEAGDETLSQPVDWIVYPDRADKPFVEAALYCGAMLLTGNLRDFPFADVKALSPDEFLAWWKSSTRASDCL